jgi:hypothetical protein
VKAPYGSQSTVLKGVGVEIKNSPSESPADDSLVSELEQLIRKIRKNVKTVTVVLIIMLAPDQDTFIQVMAN